jgi:hypothetical protein
MEDSIVTTTTVHKHGGIDDRNMFLAEWPKPGYTVSCCKYNRIRLSEDRSTNGVAAHCIKILDKVHLSYAPRIQADRSAGYAEYTTVLRRINIENFLPEYR